MEKALLKMEDLADYSHRHITLEYTGWNMKWHATIEGKPGTHWANDEQFRIANKSSLASIIAAVVDKLEDRK